jgi:hypothetical protein
MESEDPHGGLRIWESHWAMPTYKLQSIPAQNAQSTTYPATKRRFRLSRHNDYYMKGGIPYRGTRIPPMPLYGMPH